MQSCMPMERNFITSSSNSNIFLLAKYCIPQETPNLPFSKLYGWLFNSFFCVSVSIIEAIYLASSLPFISE